MRHSPWAPVGHARTAGSETPRGDVFGREVRVPVEAAAAVDCLPWQAPIVEGEGGRGKARRFSCSAGQRPTPPRGVKVKVKSEGEGEGELPLST